MAKKVAFVTGSTSGIGQGIVKKLLKKGYIVYSNGRKNFLKSKDFIQADMSDEVQIKNALLDIFKKEKRIDLIVANLGSGKSISGWDVSSDEFQRILDINLLSSIKLATNSIQYLKKTKGNIIFISSIAGCEDLGAPIAYSVAKTALLSYAKNLSSKVASLGIRINSISPGNVMFKNSTWENKFDENKDMVEEYIKKNVPLNKFAKPKDIAKSVLFLEKNDFVTGINLIVDGGQINKII